MEIRMLKEIVEKLKTLVRSEFSPIDGLCYRTADYRDPGIYSYTSDFKPLESGSVLLPGTTFIKGGIKMPDKIEKGDNFEDYLSVVIPYTEGFLLVDGEHYHGIDCNRSRIPLRKEWSGKTVELEIVAYGKQRTFVQEIGFEKVDKTIENCYYTFKVAYDFIVLEDRGPENDNVHIRVGVHNALEAAVKDLDLDLTGEALRKNVRKAEKLLVEGLEKIDDGDVRGIISLIGHTHIDVAWLWQLKDTVRKCGHSFTNILRLMEEFPEFTFACSQLQLMDYTKTYYPEVFEQIKKRVKEGRWEIVGPMWVESDCNMTSGESLIRQIIYGIKFSKKEFGTRSDIAWLPDTFGFQPNIPQILKKSGTDYLYTYKLHWQSENRFPYGMFKWQGIDGSEVLSAIANTPLAYNGEPTPSQLRRAKNNNLQNGKFDNLIFPYGHGDGGGGPTRGMIEYARRVKDFPGLPRTKIEKASEYFARLEKVKEELPTWFGELYIETHRGTLTSQGLVKRNNRMAEITYQNAEKLGVIAMAVGDKPDWSKIGEGWKKILTMQFHDILPGSSINEVYTEDCAQNYAEIFTLSKEFMNSITSKVSGKYIAVFNFLSWERDAICEYECSADEVKSGETICDMDGNSVPCDITVSGGNAKIVFEAKNLPSLGFKAYRLKAADAPAGKTAVITEKDGGYVVETGGYIVEIDALGRISRLYDKGADRETLSAPANDIRLFRDGPQDEDAWNIFKIYMDRPVDVKWNVKLSVKENGSTRTVIGVEKSAEKCKIMQDIIIYKNSPVIDFRTKVDWAERHKVLRVYFPAKVKSQYAAYEVGFGTFLRPTIANNPYEQSKFEVCAHKFADLSEGDYGVSVLNDCKYGHNCVDNTIGLTLLRGTTHPDTKADLGVHEINYSLYPHKGDWRAAQTARRGYELNNAAMLFGISEEAALRGSGRSFASVDNHNIIIDTIKPAEDGNGYIMRVYECNGNRGKAAITLTAAPKSVVETNLIEEEIGRVKTAKKSFGFEFGPYEIKTFRIIP
jgi:alpha-mannosidase